MKRSKKVLAILLGCFCLFGLMTGCGGGGDPQEEVSVLLASELTWRDRNGAESYTDDNVNTPFFSHKSDAVTYFANAMYKSYGYLTYDNQSFVGMGVGWAPAWYEWIALIRNWSDNESTKNIWRNYVIDVPISEDGYVWSYDTPHWPDLGFVDSHHNFHYDSNFRFVITVWNYCAWENSLALLDEVDTAIVSDQTEGNEGTYHQAEDVSMGLTVGEKLEMAVEYVMTTLHGEDGLIIIDENANDGLNVGTTDSYSSNYWDNIPFGYKDAYENILFYNMLNCMTELETMRGNGAQAQSYAALAEEVKENFNQTFWVEETGRYAGTVDINGTVRDYGLTFVNTEAVAYGLASAEQAESIYAWLDGDRIVEGDTSTGEDIYYYVAAPRSNTVDFAAVVDTSGENRFWWHDNNGGQALSGDGTYGYHVENGGAILYTEFYDIMGRALYLGADNAYGRMLTLAREYAEDELYRDPVNPISGGRDVLGFIGEFPESGLVPTAYLYGFIGVGLNASGLTVEPRIPEGYQYMGVRDMVYGGESYTLVSWRDGRVMISCDAGLDVCLTVADIAGRGTASVTLYDSYDNKIGTLPAQAEGGSFTVDLSGRTDVAYALIG